MTFICLQLKMLSIHSTLKPLLNLQNDLLLINPLLVQKKAHNKLDFFIILVSTTVFTLT